MLRLAHYDLNIEFLRGKENVIADVLSRVCPLQSTHPKTIDSNIDVIPVHITQSAPVSKTRLQELRLATQSDLTLTSLTNTVHDGWPQSKKDCPEQLLDFWSFIQEISEEDGLLYKSHRLIVLYSERLETLKVLHLGHYAVDYYSRFPILCKLNRTTARVLIQEMKAVFAELGVPSVIVSDGGPQYTATEFQDFTKHWQIKHRLSSLRNPQSNGMVEHFVQTMKASLIKTIEEGEDVDLALLTYKTMPLNHRLPSPAELLNSRKYKTLLSTRIVPTRLQESYK